MRLRSGLLAFAVVCVFVVPQRVEGAAILFNDRGAFDAALEGDYQLFTEFPITDFSLVQSLILAGDYGGVRFAGDPFNQILFGDPLSSYPRPDGGL